MADTGLKEQRPQGDSMLCVQQLQGDDEHNTEKEITKEKG